jgi:hypothetical protein
LLINLCILLELPNIFGRILCGPEFSLRLEDYGYTIKPATIIVDEPVSNNSSVINKDETNKQDLKIVSKKVTSSNNFQKL